MNRSQKRSQPVSRAKIPPRRKPKQRPQLVAKAKIQPRRGPPQKKKKDQVSIAYKKKPGLRDQITQDEKHRKKEGCLMPGDSAIELTFERSWGIVIDQIDAFMAQAQIDNPSLFARVPNTDSVGYADLSPPQIPFNGLRAVWLIAIQQYFQRIGIIAENALSNQQKISGILLPNGLAKFVQHFAPSPDPITGAIKRFTIPALPTTTMLLVPAYPDISENAGSYGSDITTNAQVPRDMYLLHPSTYGNPSTNVFDLVTADGRTNPSYPIVTPPVTQSIADYVAELDQTIKYRINKLFDGVPPDYIGNFAPDASFYAITATRVFAVTCPSPNFNSEFAMMGPGWYAAANFQPDFGANYPYTKPFPSIAANKPGTDLGTQDAILRVMRKFYAYLSTKVQKYVKTTGCISQLYYTPCFGMVKSLSFLSVQIDINMLAERFTEYVATLNNNDSNSSTPTDYFSVLTNLWSSALRRIVNTDWIMDSNDNYSGYAMGINSLSCKLPITMANLISSIGPVVVEGKLYIPVLKQQMGSWMDSVSISGAWQYFPAGNNPANTKIGQAFYSNTALNLSILFPTTSPITYPSGVKFTIGPLLSCDWWVEKMKVIRGETWSNAVPLAKQCFGSPPVMLSSISTKFISLNASSSQSTDTFIIGLGTLNRCIKVWFGSVTSFVCITHFDASRMAVLGVVSNTTTPNATNLIKSQSVTFKTPPNGMLAIIQTECSGEFESVAAGQVVADSKRKDLKFKDGMTQPDMEENNIYGLTQRPLVAQLRDVASDLFNIEEETYGLSNEFKEFAKDYVRNTPILKPFENVTSETEYSEIVKLAGASVAGAVSQVASNYVSPGWSRVAGVVANTALNYGVNAFRGHQRHNSL